MQPLSSGSPESVTLGDRASTCAAGAHSRPQPGKGSHHGCPLCRTCSAHSPGTSLMSPELPLGEDTATPCPKVRGHHPPSAGGIQALTPCSVPFCAHQICKVLVISQHSTSSLPLVRGSSCSQASPCSSVPEPLQWFGPKGRRESFIIYAQYRQGETRLNGTM